MSKKVTFSNEQFCEVWKSVSSSNGDRMSVVVRLMEMNGIENTPENRRKMYNNVTQRYRILSTKHGLVFPALAEGRRGSNLIGDKAEKLQSLLS